MYLSVRSQHIAMLTTANVALMRLHHAISPRTRIHATSPLAVMPNHATCPFVTSPFRLQTVDVLLSLARRQLR